MKTGLLLVYSYFKEHPRTYTRVVIVAVIIGLLELVGISSLVPAVGILLGEQISGIPAPVIKLVQSASPTVIIVAYLVLVVVQMLVSILNETLFLNTMIQWSSKLTWDFLHNILRVEF